MGDILFKTTTRRYSLWSHQLFYFADPRNTNMYLPKHHFGSQTAIWGAYAPIYLSVHALNIAIWVLTAEKQPPCLRIVNNGRDTGEDITGPIFNDLLYRIIAVLLLLNPECCGRHTTTHVLKSDNPVSSIFQGPKKPREYLPACYKGIVAAWK